jgi:hypothetical protein
LGELCALQGSHGLVHSVRTVVNHQRRGAAWG